MFKNKIRFLSYMQMLHVFSVYTKEIIDKLHKSFPYNLNVIAIKTSNPDTKI